MTMSLGGGHRRRPSIISGVLLTALLLSHCFHFSILCVSDLGDSSQPPRVRSAASSLCMAVSTGKTEGHSLIETPVGRISQSSPPTHRVNPGGYDSSSASCFTLQPVEPSFRSPPTVDSVFHRTVPLFSATAMYLRSGNNDTCLYPSSSRSFSLPAESLFKRLHHHARYETGQYNLWASIHNRYNLHIPPFSNLCSKFSAKEGKHHGNDGVPEPVVVGCPWLDLGYWRPVSLEAEVCSRRCVATVISPVRAKNSDSYSTDPRPATRLSNEILTGSGCTVSPKRPGDAWTAATFTEKETLMLRMGFWAKAKRIIELQQIGPLDPLINKLEGFGLGWEFSFKSIKGLALFGPLIVVLGLYSKILHQSKPRKKTKREKPHFVKA